MKKHILLLLALGATSISYAQETPPATDMKQLSTSTFYLHLPDSAIWHYKGVAYGWERLGRYSDLKNYITTNTTQITPGITASKNWKAKQYITATLASHLTGEAALDITGDFSGQVGSAPGFLLRGERKGSPSTGVQGLFNFSYNGVPQVRAYNVGGFSSVGGINVGGLDSLTSPVLHLDYITPSTLLKVDASKNVVPAVIGTDYLAGTISAPQGGTGITSYTAGDLLAANTTSSLTKLSSIATGNALLSGGVGVAPFYGKIGLTTHVTGVLPVNNGGTGTAANSPLGGVPYATSPTIWGYVAPNTTTTKKFLRETGTGTVGAAPAWDVLTAGDIPEISTLSASNIGNEKIPYSNGTNLTSSPLLSFSTSTNYLTLGAPGASSSGISTTSTVGNALVDAGRLSITTNANNTLYQQLTTSEEARISNTTVYRLLYGNASGSANVYTGSPMQYTQNVGIGVSPTSKLSILNSNIGTNGNLNNTGISLLNDQPATNTPLHQNSPALMLGGRFWDGVASASKDIRFATDVESVGTGINSAALVTKRSADGGTTYTEIYRVNATDFTVQGTINASTSVSAGNQVSAPNMFATSKGIFGGISTIPRTALLLMNSTTQGFLLPRMFTSEITALSPGAGGALVQAIQVTNGGSGYTTATVSLTGGGSPTTAATATAIVSGGKVIGINVTHEGAGYSSLPTPVITGDGTGATAVAYSVALGLQTYDRQKERISLYTSGGYKDIAYTDDLTNYVTKSTTQTITGDKIFTGTVNFGASAGSLSRLNISDDIGGSGAHGINIETHSNSTNVGTAIYGKRSSGTGASPTAVANNMYGLIIKAMNHDGSNYLSNGYIGYRTKATPTSGSVPGAWFFSVSNTDDMDPYGSGSIKLEIQKDNIVASVPIGLKVYTVSTLPTGVLQGVTAAVNDAIAPTYLGTLTGGGSVFTPVVYNGSAWVSY